MVGGALIFFLINHRFNLILTVNLTIFWLEIFLLPFPRLFISGAKFNQTAILVACLGLLFHIALVRTGSWWISPEDGQPEPIIKRCAEVSYAEVAWWMIAFLVFKIYLLKRYGMVAAFRPGLGRLTRMSGYDEAVAMIIPYPGLGVLFAYTVQAGLNPRKILSFRSLLPVIFLAFVIFTGENNAVRRTLITYTLTFFWTLLYQRRFRVTLTLATQTLIPLLLVAAFSGYFQVVRGNFEATAALMLKHKASMTPGRIVKSLIVPAEGSEAFSNATEDNLKERVTQFELLVAIIDREHDHPWLTANGELTRQALSNSLPAALQRHKEMLDTDEIISNHFDFPYTDLATSPWGDLAADYGYIWAFLLAPVLLLLFYLIGKAISTSSLGRSALLGPAALAFLFGLMLTAAEGGINDYIASVRSLLIFSVLTIPFFLLRLLGRAPWWHEMLHAKRSKRSFARASAAKA
jgi:hypothetical protein